MLAAAVVSLLFRVADGLTQSSCDRLLVWAVNSEPLVVLVEVFDSVQLLEFFLQSIFNWCRQAAIIAIQVLLHLAHGCKTAFQHFAERMEEHGDLESSEASFEANLIPSFFDYDVLPLILWVSMVKFGNL